MARSVIVVVREGGDVARGDRVYRRRRHSMNPPDVVGGIRARVDVQGALILPATQREDHQPRASTSEERRGVEDAGAVKGKLCSSRFAQARG